MDQYSHEFQTKNIQSIVDENQILKRQIAAYERQIAELKQEIKLLSNKILYLSHGSKKNRTPAKWNTLLTDFSNSPQSSPLIKSVTQKSLFDYKEDSKLPTNPILTDEKIIDKELEITTISNDEEKSCLSPEINKLAEDLIEARTESKEKINLSPIKPLSPKKSKPIQRKINTTFLAAAKLVKPKTPIKSLPKPFHMKNISPAKKVQYLETYRKKEDRAKLKGFDCIECKKYYEMLKLSPGEVEKRMKSCSRHRAMYSPPKTPSNFWSPGIIKQSPKKAPTAFSEARKKIVRSKMKYSLKYNDKD